MSFVLTICLGVLTWLLAEYLIHRFLGHARKIRTEFGREHTRHHSVGDYFAPTWKKAFVAVQVLGLMMLIGVPLAGWALGTTYAVSFALTYVGYEVAHRRAHTHPPTGPYSRWLRKHHFYHHFHDPKMNHGVTSPLGDVLLGTRVVPEKVRVPERLAMRWLVDPATGEVRAEHAADYELLRRPTNRSADASAASILAVGAT